MGHVFSHLSKTDRYKIEALLNQGHTGKCGRIARAYQHDLPRNQTRPLAVFGR